MGDAGQIDRLASLQRGVFNRAQATAAGFDRSAISRRIERGSWVRLDDSVFALASSPATWEQTVTAAMLSRPDAALTHRTACRLFGVGDFGKDRPVVLLPRGSNVRSEIADVFETDQYERIATTTVDGFRVTTMPETLLVIARDVRGAPLQDLFDMAVVARRLDLVAMAAVIDREAGRRTPGTPQLRRLTSSRRPDAPAKDATYLERILDDVLDDPALPYRSDQHEFSLDGEPARVDVYFPGPRVVVEADGRNWHARWTDMERDRRRDNALAARGIQVLRYTYQMLTTDPGHCREQIVTICLLRAA